MYVLFIASPAGAVAKCCDECLCLCVCLSVRKDMFGTRRAISTKFFVHVAYVCGSVLLQHVDDRPHGLSAGRGDGTALRGRSVIYDCLVVNLICHWLCLCALYRVWPIKPRNRVTVCWQHCWTSRLS